MKKILVTVLVYLSILEFSACGNASKVSSLTQDGGESNQQIESSTSINEAGESNSDANESNREDLLAENGDNQMDKAESSSKDSIEILGSEDAKYSFILTIVNKEKETVEYMVYTDEKNIGDALFSLGIVDDPEFITVVCDEYADWNKDKAYWALYEGDEYASVGLKDMKLDKKDYNIRIEYTAE